MGFDKSAYDRQYMKQNVAVKNIIFNRTKPEDMELLDWINQQKPSGNQYVKDLVREDMTRKKSAE